MARAAKLARWAERGVPVGVGGQILEEPLAAATEHLGLAADEDGAAYTAEAWQLAVDTGLVEIAETEESEDGADLPDDAAVSIATPGEELGLLTSGSPQDILDIWLGGMETVLADAATPTSPTSPTSSPRAANWTWTRSTGTRRRRPSCWTASSATSICSRP